MSEGGHEARYLELWQTFPTDMDGCGDGEAERSAAHEREVNALLDRFGQSIRPGARLHVFDVDGTWVTPASGSAFPRDAYDWALLPGRADTLRWLRLHRIKIALASNQGGVAFGYRTYEQALTYVHRIGWRLHAHPVQVCPHHPQGTVERYRRDCPYRKPKCGMLLAILHEADVDSAHALYVGDREEDEQAAAAAGIAFAWAEDYFRAPWLAARACTGRGAGTPPQVAATPARQGGGTMSAAEHTPAQLALRRILEQISEDRWRAQWDSGMEVRLWRWVQEGPRGVLLCAEERDVLRWLSEQAGGWWTWPKGEIEPRFVAMQEWLRFYARAREREEESPP